MGEILEADIAHVPSVIDRGQSPGLHRSAPHAGGSLAQPHQAADALLSLSYQENFGYAAAEATPAA